MNERIGQLAEQANLLGPSSRIGNSHEAAEKFAELIVLECADFVAQNTLEDQGMWGKIVRHFGVEE
jgi:hypothetical protein